MNRLVFTTTFGDELCGFAERVLVTVYKEDMLCAVDAEEKRAYVAAMEFQGGNDIFGVQNRG